MKFQFSAGGIVFRSSQNLGFKPKFSNQRIEILVCQHSQHHGWVFPKGLIGDHIKDEGKKETALREVKEETGILGKIIKPLNPIGYWFILDGEKIQKTVYYFIMEYVAGDTDDHDFEMENVEWLKKEKVEKRLTYESDKKVWQEAEKYLASSL
jgi:8-oxo-dGTP pyrophosphatase MutT (NUDIX family)